MALANYSVPKGDPQRGRVAFNREGKNPCYQITLDAAGRSLEAAVNIQSDDGSEVLYLVDHAFVPPDPAALKAPLMGVHRLVSAPGGLALDFVREQVNGAAMLELDSMSLLPKSFPAGHRHNDLNNEVVDLLNRAVQDPNGTMYVLGDAVSDGGGSPNGIHDMNQGNPAGSHDQDNGIRQNGALFVNLPAQQDAWIAVFSAFQTQSWQAGDQGNPLQAAAAGNQLHPQEGSMLHAITAVKPKVQSAIDKAIVAFQQDNPVVRQKMNEVLNPADEAQRQEYRQKILAALETAKNQAASDPSNPDDFFVPRDAEVGLAQSAMNAAVEQNAASAAPAEAPFEQFGPLDPGWIECLVDGFKTLFTGKARFVQHHDLSDFLVAIPDRASIALVADWGAHNTAAASVAGQIRAANPDICIHLGDIYYAGQNNEADEFLSLWPLADKATRRITVHSSFALNGNHEMFSGGKAYFGRVLTAFGQPASYFGLRNSEWQILAFDSAYVEQRLLGPAEATGANSALLSQWEWLVDKIANSGGRETILLCHHQPFSAFTKENSDGAKLKQDVENLLKAAAGRLFGWFFGHEHLCTIYDEKVSGFRARLIGNGCIPHAAPTLARPDPECQPFTDMNRGTNAIGDALSGFALLKLDGGGIDVQYINEDGTQFGATERWQQALGAGGNPHPR